MDPVEIHLHVVNGNSVPGSGSHLGGKICQIALAIRPEGEDTQSCLILLNCLGQVLVLVGVLPQPLVLMCLAGIAGFTVICCRAVTLVLKSASIVVACDSAKP